VTSSYDALLDLFECLGNFLKRLEVYTTIPPIPMMIDLIVKIMVELLSVLALTTKQIKQGRFSECINQIYVGYAQCVAEKFVKKLLGKRNGKIQGSLERLDRLTKDEGLSAVAQTLGIVQKGSNEMNRIKRLLFLPPLRCLDRRYSVVQHWLSPPDPSTNQNFVSKLRHEGTTEWFFESSALTEWKAKGSLLWVHGKRTSFELPMSALH
jgi:hypothetical protein